MTLQKAAVKTTPKKLLKCPNCGSKRLSQYNKKIVCTNCSFVIDPNNTKNKPKKPIRQNSLQTSQDSPIVHLDLGEHSSKKWQKLLRVSDSTEESLATVLLEITRIGQCISLPEETLKLSLGVYKTIIQANLTKRTPTRVLAAAIIYIACRQAGVARSLNEIAHLSKISPGKMRHTHNAIVKHLASMSRATTPSTYVRRLSTGLFKQEKTVEMAEKIIQCLKDQKFAQGKNPVGLAASACYIASIVAGESKTQREIAEVARITESTMQTRYRQIAKQLSINISL
jgi:transcription initiation factor TFIIB